MKEPESDPWALFPDPYCACGRHFREHSEQDLKACGLQFGEVNGDHIEIVTSRFKGDDPDPAKRAEKRRRMMPLVMQSVCECGKTVAEHSREEILACAHKQRDIQLKDVLCPICNKLVLEHSHGESVACTEKYNEQQRGEHGV